jgi:hypothetical protein
MRIYETRTALRELKKGNVGAIVQEMKGQAKLGMTMMQEKRMHFKVAKVQNKAEVKALFRKAKSGKGA